MSNQTSTPPSTLRRATACAREYEHPFCRWYASCNLLEAHRLTRQKRIGENNEPRPIPNIREAGGNDSPGFSGVSSRLPRCARLRPLLCRHIQGHAPSQEIEPCCAPSG